MRQAVTSLASFPCPPCLPRRGISRPPPHKAVGRGRARAFLCSSPVTAPASFPSALGQGRCRPFPLPQGPAPPLLIFARCFLSRPQILGFPVRFVLLLRSTDLSSRRPALQSPGSRRGVAPCRLGAPPAAPFSPALPRGRHRPSGPGCAPPFRPPGFPRPSAPVGLPPCLRGRPDDRCAATGPPLRHFVLLFCPVPADLTA